MEITDAERVSDGTSAQLGYTVPFRLDDVKKITLYAIAYRRCLTKMPSVKYTARKDPPMVAGERYAPAPRATFPMVAATSSGPRVAHVARDPPFFNSPQFILVL